jgi:hypothetical protein
MTPQLSKELSDALQASEAEELEVMDPQTQRLYVICDPGMHQQAKRVLDREAIRAGIQQMENGETQPVDEAFEEMRVRLGFAPRS